MASNRSMALACAIGCLAAMGLSACGSDDGGNTSPSTTPPATPAAATTSGGAKAASGTPLKVLVSSFVDSPIGSVPEVWAGAEVAAASINAKGGVNGHPLEVVRCNGKGDPKAELACGRKGVSEGVIASDSNVFVVNPQGALQVLDRGGVTDVAGATGTPALYSLPSMYPIEFSAAVQNACVSKQALDSAGPDVKFGVIVGENPYSAGSWALMERYIKSDPAVGAKFAGSVSSPATTDDFSSLVQSLADKGTNYVVVDLPPADAARFVTAAGTSGKKWTMCADGGLFGPQLLKKLGPLTKSFLTVLGLPPVASAAQDPLIQQFVDEMKAALDAGNKDASIEINHSNSLRSWLGMHVIADVAKTVKGDVTTKSFAAAMKTAKVDLDYSTIDFAEARGTAPYQRVFQPNAFISKWNGDQKQFDGIGQVNLLDLLGK